MGLKSHTELGTCWKIVSPFVFANVFCIKTKEIGLKYEGDCSKLLPYGIEHYEKINGGTK